MCRSPRRMCFRLTDIIREVMGDDVEIAAEPSDDLRSYHVSSERIGRELGFRPRCSIRDAVKGLAAGARECGGIGHGSHRSRKCDVRGLQRARRRRRRRPRLAWLMRIAPCVPLESQENPLTPMSHRNFRR